MTTDKQLQGCKIDFTNYEDWRFLYSYESNGQDVVLVVTVVDGEDDIEFHLNGQSIGLVPDDFIGCEDIDDCSFLIAKHLIKSNADNDLSICIKSRTSKYGYIVIVPKLTNIRAVNTAKIAFLPGKLPLVKTYPATADIIRVIITIPKV